MKNTITASIHFSFKGKQHTPSIAIELDRYLVSTGKLPDFYPLIAKENNFDLYSYEYEMMQSVEIIFSHAQGLITNFINEGILDFVAFEAAWHEQYTLTKLHDIAKAHLQIKNLDEQPRLQQALVAAYKLGQNDANS